MKQKNDAAAKAAEVLAEINRRRQAKRDAERKAAEAKKTQAEKAERERQEAARKAAEAAKAQAEKEKAERERQEEERRLKAIEARRDFIGKLEKSIPAYFELLEAARKFAKAIEAEEIEQAFFNFASEEITIYELAHHLESGIDALAEGIERYRQEIEIYEMGAPKAKKEKSRGELQQEAMKALASGEFKS